MAEQSITTVDEVLDKLKSNGTFDHFRKTCLESIEAEPSFRAYGEHIEVVSRRYLHNFKWRDSTTKNQVRIRLKDHALSVIASPDIQVGVSFSSLVEKAMEAKGKELLPKIQSVIKTLCQAKPVPLNGSDSTKTKPKTTQASVSTKPESEFDFSLPIDLPGLSASYTSSVTTARKPADAKAGKAKHKQAESGAKDARSGTTKPKTQPSSGDGKSDVAQGKEEGKENAGKVEAAAIPAVTKDKEKRTTKVKKVREETREKSSQDKPKEVPKADEVVVQKKEIKAKVGGVSTITTGSKDGQDEDADGKKSELENKPTRRRSVRLASLTEKNSPSDGESDTKIEDSHETQRHSVEGQVTRHVTKKKHPNKSRALTRKRARVWSSSSSDESDGYEPPKRSKMADSDKTKDGREHKISAKHPLIDNQEAPSSSGKHPMRRRSKSGSPMDQDDNPAGASRRKSKTPQRLSRASKSPLKSPPTVTRFNRLVKPNRKYYTSSDEQEEVDSDTRGTASGYSSGDDD